jgi:DNA-binding MarR family transcriptional regulator
MEEKYNRRESWEKEHGGAPIKCVLDVSKNLRYFFDQQMSENGLTSIQSRVLGYLRMEETKGNCVFQRDIEEVFRIKRSSVTSVLQTLEKKALIQRESIPEDARVKKLVLTDKAREMQTSTYRDLERMEKEIRSLFSDEEFRGFLDYMNRIDQKVIEIYDNKEEKND